ncbi:endonuclease/exonuclease/phosphatase family protein [Frankia sp. R82]|uniref:endonuclease/exonuclease/phosphatase family protein n=1 Tax=Frankia sp. R82 TaxID=2950553 RepID=UPI002042C9C2|nr:endonuclease/exonuclease/phosphatase family protein [Frankia sp. R82]MCM3885939.1 endonuclease/exonuclease/phosphatase family protein [Frankia sp. R82]
MRLGTFNVMHGRSLTDGEVQAERFLDAVAGLDADVLGLQEVDRDQPRSGQLDLAALAAQAMGAGDGDWCFVPTVFGTPGESWRPADIARPGGQHIAGERPAITGSHEDDAGEPAYGIALISRLPVQEWRVIELGRAPVRSPIALPGGGPGSRARLILLDDEPRIAIAAILDSADGPLTVVTTHLSFVPGWNAWQLRRLTRRLAEMDGPVVILGDLNLPGALPGLLTRWHRLAASPTYPAPAPQVQLDHVLARGPIGEVRAVHCQRTPVSDHRALLVDLIPSTPHTP